MIAIEGLSSHFLVAITAIVNLIARGEVMDYIKSFYSWKVWLHSQKKWGGVRELDQSLSICHCDALLPNSSTILLLRNYPHLTQIQLGVGVSGDLESAVHADRQYIWHLDPDAAIVKLDFCNTFNNIHRDAILKTVSKSFPAA